MASKAHWINMNISVICYIIGPEYITKTRWSIRDLLPKLVDNYNHNFEQLSTVSVTLIGLVGVQLLHKWKMAK